EKLDSREVSEKYTKAYQGLDERSEYRRMVEIKLNAMGVDPKPLAAAPAAAAAASGASKP
ncbi:MAG: hypothetical protein ABI919_13975, partial [Ramlibacter sp.]